MSSLQCKIRELITMSKTNKKDTKNLNVTLNEIDTLNPLSLDCLDNTQCNSQKEFIALIEIISQNIEFDNVELLFNSLDYHNNVDIREFCSQKSLWINREYTKRANFAKKEFTIVNGLLKISKNSYIELSKIIEFKYDCLRFTLKGKTILCVTVHNGYLVEFNVDLHNQRVNEYKLKNSKTQKVNEFDRLLKTLNIDTNSINVNEIDTQKLKEILLQ